jgi:predicted phage-related endonuclease
MGASLDYRVIAHEAGPGAFEIKNVDSLIFRQKFEQVEDGRVEAPPHIELQLQHQLAVTGYKWGMIGVLVGGNDPKLIRRSRIPSVIEVIEQKITEFWDSIKKGDEPKITEEADFKTFEKLFNPSETLKELEPTQDLWRRLENYQYREKQEKEAKALKEAAKADLLNLFAEHDAETLLIPNEDGQSWKLSYKEINKAEHIVNASSYRVFRLSEPK